MSKLAALIQLKEFNTHLIWMSITQLETSKLIKISHRLSVDCYIIILQKKLWPGTGFEPLRTMRVIKK